MKSLNSQPDNTLQELYSTDYVGEWINVELGKDRLDRRFIKPNIIFENPSGNAICLGNGTSRSEYTTEKFEKTNARKILRYYNVMYGCNAIYRDWQPDFLLITNQLLASKLPNNFYDVSFAPQEIMRRYKGMNLIPGASRLDAGSAAVYLAAFHGAKRVFLYGYDGQQVADFNNNIYAGSEFYPPETETINDSLWMFNLKNVIQTYKNVEFYRVTGNPDDSYRPLLRFSNYKPITFRQFISFADL